MRKVLIPKKRFLFGHKIILSRYYFLNERENIRWMSNNLERRNTTNKIPIIWGQMLSCCCVWTTSKRQMQGRSANPSSRKKYVQIMGILTLKTKAFLEDNLERLHFTQDLQDKTDLLPIVPLWRGLSLLSVQKCSLGFLSTENLHTLTSGSLGVDSFLSFQGLDVYLLLLLLEYFSVSIPQQHPCRWCSAFLLPASPIWGDRNPRSGTDATCTHR